MIKKLMIVIMIVTAIYGQKAFAQFNGCPTGFCNTSDGGSGPPPDPCTQMSLDFTSDCNMILVPALIH